VPQPITGSGSRVDGIGRVFTFVDAGLVWLTTREGTIVPSASAAAARTSFARVGPRAQPSFAASPTECAGSRRARLLELDEHRLVIARRGARIDGDRAQARRQIAAREDEVASERIGPLMAVVHADRRRLRLGRMEALPDVLQRR